MAKLVVMYPKPKDRSCEILSRGSHPTLRKKPGIRSYSYGYPTGPDGKDGAFFCFLSQRSIV